MFTRALSLGLTLIGLVMVLGCTRPEDKLMRLVEKRLETVNQGDYGVAVEWLEPEFRQGLEVQVGDLRPLLGMQRRLDQETGRIYRAVELTAFEKDAYAEVVLERSGPAGVFEGKELFVVPMVFHSGTWWIVGEMKDGQSARYRLRR